MRIEVILIGVAREQREPCGVRFGDRAAKWMLIGSADLEIFEKPAKLRGNNFGHGRIMHQALGRLTGNCLGCEQRDFAGVVLSLIATAPTLFDAIHEPGLWLARRS